MWQYRLYGLTVQSSRALAWLAPEPVTKPVDWRVWFNTPSPELSALQSLPQEIVYTDADRRSDGDAALRIGRIAGGTHYRLATRYGLEFIVDGRGTTAWATWPENAPLESAALAILLGPLAGIVMGLRGITCVHASVAAIDGYAVALAGVSGVGKTTAAAALAARGHAVLADDLAVLTGSDESLLVQPGFPRLGLWPDAMDLLRHPLTAVAPVHTDLPKGSVGLPALRYAFHAEPAPLAAVCLLERQEAEAGLGQMDRLSPAAGLALLLAIARTPYHLLGPHQQLDEFAALSRVAARVPIYRLAAGSGKDALDTLCENIEHSVSWVRQS